MRKASHVSPEHHLTRRERQIMDIVYAQGEVSAREIWQKLPDAPTYSTVRTLLSVLERKKHMTRKLVGKAFMYQAIRPRQNAAAAATRRLLHTFFGGSIEHAVSALIDLEDPNLTEAELARIAKLITQARKEKQP